MAMRLLISTLVTGVTVVSATSLRAANYTIVVDEIQGDYSHSRLQQLPKVEGGARRRILEAMIGESSNLSNNVHRLLDKVDDDDMCLLGGKKSYDLDQSRGDDEYCWWKVGKLIRKCDNEDKELCLYRQPMLKKSDRSRCKSHGSGRRTSNCDMSYFINPWKARCIPKDANCDRCARGRWCLKPKRCIHEDFYREYRKKYDFDEICPGDWV